MNNWNKIKDWLMECGKLNSLNVSTRDIYLGVITRMNEIECSNKGEEDKYEKFWDTSKATGLGKEFLRKFNSLRVSELGSNCIVCGKLTNYQWTLGEGWRCEECQDLVPCTVKDVILDMSLYVPYKSEVDSITTEHWDYIKMISQVPKIGQEIYR